MTTLGRRLLMVWLVALALSWAWRVLPHPVEPIPADLDVAQVRAVDLDGRPLDGSVRMAWRAWGDAAADTTPVVLLHGSPGSHRDFTSLGPALASTRRVLAPDLPGFGASSLRVPAYSLAAHAAQVDDWLDQLAIPRAHVVGFSMGGGVALELVARKPERVASLVLLSSLGVEELELLGQHDLNHAVHRGALVTTSLVDLTFPHFGALDRFPLGVPWARNFADTDQRRLRPILATLDQPTLIVHGKQDILVPLAAAHESARLVAQAELVELDDDHFMVFRDGAALASTIAPFLDAVEEGAAPHRAQADPARLAAAAVPWDPATAPAAEGFPVVVAGVLLALATLVSEDLASISGGLLVGQGRLPYLAVTLACAIGIFVGDLLLFLAGRSLGRAAVRRRPLSWWLDEERLDRASEWFRRRGPIVILVSRFTPGARLPTYFAAGVLRTPLWRFTGWFALSVALWTPILVGLAAWLGSRVEGLLERGLPVLLLGALALVVVVRSLLVPLATRVGRRGLVGRWRRLTQWEFWPTWALYPPVVLWILWLGLRHRGPTLFSAVNPGFPAASGFVGESKAEILRLLPQDDPRVPAWTTIPPGSADERLRLVEAFLRTHQLDFPVVLKPDIGQRGEGVRICRDLDAVVAALVAEPATLIAQEYLPGVEIGAFWYRFPGQAHGNIFAITNKQLPEVVGDGQRTNEDLVLDDPRAVILADLYLANLGSRRFLVPAAGERVRLAELGTHCRGAIFLDGADLRTPALDQAIDDLSSRIEGFNFGRWDLRATNAEALARGEVRVVELNGVTSEATSIYDPKYSVVHGWRVLLRQWSLAFAIGAAERARGTRPATVGELWRLVRAHLGRPAG